MGFLRADEVAFGAAAEGAGHVRAGGGFAFAGQDEMAKRRPLAVQPFDFPVEGGDGRGLELWPPGREFGANEEYVALDGFEPVGVGLGAGMGAQEAEDGIEFVEGPEGVEEDIGLGKASEAGKRGGAVVVHAREKWQNPAGQGKPGAFRASLTSI